MGGIIVWIILLGTLQFLMVNSYSGNNIWDDRDGLPFLFRAVFVVKLFLVCYLMMEIPIPGWICILLALTASIISYALTVTIGELIKAISISKASNKKQSSVVDDSQYDYNKLTNKRRRFYSNSNNSSDTSKNELR